MNGSDVSYSLRMGQDEGDLQCEVAIEGKIYNAQNADISFTKKVSRTKVASWKGAHAQPS